MQRLGLSFGLLLLVGHLVCAQPPNAEQRQATVKYVQSLQKDSGGFAADTKPATPATLGATSSALRALKYFGGKIENREKCASFVRTCHAPGESGYGATPGADPDVRNTALGLMAAAELGLEFGGSRKDYPAICYLPAHAATFEEIRLSAAALETVKHAYRSDRWLAEVNKLRNPDGTYGKDGNLARDTASCVVTLLRLDQKLDDAQDKEVIKVLKAGQRADGAWGKEGTKNSDLETTYRVMRCFHMLKGKPDVAACQAFIAKCRNEDGSYSVEPGQPGNVSGTYFAGVVLHWLSEE